MVLAGTTFGFHIGASECDKRRKERRCDHLTTGRMKAVKTSRFDLTRTWLAARY